MVKSFETHLSFVFRKQTQNLSLRVICFCSATLVFTPPSMFACIHPAPRPPPSQYLSQRHVPPTKAVLLGLAASKRGSGDSTVSRTLCCHLPALPPLSSLALEVPTLVQVSVCDREYTLAEA
jgi:hypothetical protein